MLHGGIAFRIWKFSLEAAAMVSPTFEGIGAGGGTKVPERAGVSLSLGFDIDF